jgi:hypothetical protein
MLGADRLSVWDSRIIAHRKLCFFAILAVALCLRTVRYERWPGPCISQSAELNEISRIGHSLADRVAFADPFILPTGPTAHHAPVYPLLLAAIYRTVPRQDWLSSRVIMNILLSSAVCPLAFLAGLELGIGALASVLGAVVLALAPMRISVEMCNDQEAALITALAVSVMWFSARFLNPTRAGPMPALTGLVWGLCLLAAPALLLVFGCFVLWTLLQRRYRQALIILGLVVLVLTPWTIRNRLQLGGWFPIRDSLWLELRVSNADQSISDASLNAERGAMQLYHPLFSTAAAERIRQHGELAEYDDLKRQTIAWMRAHPARFLELTIERFSNFWVPLGTSRIQFIWRIGVYLLAAVGIVLLYRTRPSLTFLPAMFLIVYPLPYYLTQSYSRYGYPVEWLVTLLAASALVSTGHCMVNGHDRRSPLARTANLREPSPSESAAPISNAG